MMNKKHSTGVLTLIAVTLILLMSGCSKHFSPINKDFQQYHVNGNIESDTSVVSIYLPFKEKLEAEMNRIIGTAPKALTKENAPETLMGNFFCDALLWLSEHNLHAKADLAFATKGGIRNDIKAGNITVGNIFEVMPFENSLTILELNGSQIRQLADYIAQTHGQPVAGITIRIQNKKVTDIRINGSPIEDNKVYKMVTYDYLANGGDNVALLTKASNRKDFPQRVREGLIDYVSELTKQGKKVEAQLDGRITINQ